MLTDRQKRYSFRYMHIKLVLSKCERAFFVQDEDGHELGVIHSCPDPEQRVAWAERCGIHVKLHPLSELSDGTYGRKRIDDLAPEDVEETFVQELVKLYPRMHTGVSTRLLSRLAPLHHDEFLGEIKALRAAADTFFDLVKEEP